jgi:hypothetical protein
LVLGVGVGVAVASVSVVIPTQARILRRRGISLRSTLLAIIANHREGCPILRSSAEWEVL